MILFTRESGSRGGASTCDSLCLFVGFVPSISLERNCQVSAKNRVCSWHAINQRLVRKSASAAVLTRLSLSLPHVSPHAKSASFPFSKYARHR